ncbi:MAG: hypothetical protein Q9227_008979 [Pyrenula ochraceoflavens]
MQEKLLKRELGEQPRHAGLRGLYGDRSWVDDLDIVNELGGHTGCVNALSWSKTGRLLASGSDDTHLNIWSYNPEDSIKPFALNTTVSTGHTQNIFSVKFMPHSNDRTVVTAAGDSQVRVFDLEYSAAAQHVSQNTTSDASTRSRRFNNFFRNTRYLNEANTNARVYRSHADRVKRIITESSPYVFLTCSEDGEVRQWDTRQPSSAYPSPRGGQGFMSLRRGDHDDSNVPPALISYKDYQLDLNTISCSGSQPHYIALGGAHLHCFLHDRRMIGRNLDFESGRTSRQTPQPGSHEDEMMGQATRCVRRFAPNGRKQVASDHLKHITACKISDAHPNEMVVSWSGDHIYSFDLVQSPDARETEAQEHQEEQEEESKPSRVKSSRNRKRKRAKAPSSTSLNNASTSRARTRLNLEDEGELSLRVRYGNGDTGELPLIPTAATEGSLTVSQGESLLTERQQISQRLGKAIFKLRKTLFDFESELRNESSSNDESNDIHLYTPAFTKALGIAATEVDRMDEIIRDWRYPVTQNAEEIGIQQTLRRHRASCRRFVQAAGTLSRVMGGNLQTLSAAEDPRVIKFRQIVPAVLERSNDIPDDKLFVYEFLRAILLWLEDGPANIVRGFTSASPNKRFPLDPGDEIRSLETKLLPYLQGLARPNRPIIDIDSSRFEVDENRQLFSSRLAATTAFFRAVSEFTLGARPSSSSIVMPPATHDSSSLQSDGQGGPDAKPSSLSGSASSKGRLDREAAKRFWGLRVGRSLLMEAGEGVNFELVNRAFGGVRIHVEDSDSEPERMQEDIDPGERDGLEDIETADLVQRRKRNNETEKESANNEPLQATVADGASDPEMSPPSSSKPKPHPTETDEPMAESRSNGHEQEEEDDDDEVEDGDFSGDDFDDDDDQDDSDEEDIPLFSRRMGYSRGGQRAKVENDKPCSSHTRIYRGHCNVKTVKDVNFYGLDDEYVVSGSDFGHLFFWDKKTTECVNILEGDGEVVNVIQGHPYEPMIACSGIDNTIKVFSPDERLQTDARDGVNLLNPNGPGTSSLRLTGRRPRSQPSPPASGGLESRKRMDKYQEIVAENNTARQGGVGDAVLTVSDDDMFTIAWLLAGDEIE